MTLHMDMSRHGNAGSAHPKHQSVAMQNKIHPRDSHTVAQCFVPGGVRSAGDIRPAIREPLEPFALQRRQPADELPASDRVDRTGRAAGGCFLERNAQVAVFTGIPAVESAHIHHEVVD